jgi:hypothetical protein
MTQTPLHAEFVRRLAPLFGTKLQLSRPQSRKSAIGKHPPFLVEQLESRLIPCVMPNVKRRHSSRRVYKWSSS